jgi:hypothetical protein
VSDGRTMPRLDIASLYDLLLGRSASEEELDHWEAISRDAPFTDVLGAFVNGVEYREACAHKLGLFALPGHFYSPIVDPRSQLQRTSPADLGIDLNVDRQRERWREMVRLANSMPYPDQRSNAYRYWYHNVGFGYADALTYTAVLLRHRPARVVEVGSGYSSALLLDTIESALPDTTVTFIEPYADVLRDLMLPIDATRATILECFVQDVDLGVFEALRANDIFFIDSSHVAKTGSDVLFELFRVLPRLESGVLIHVHDIFWPFEYPKAWVERENRSWNETYLLRALLTNNPAYEIVFWNDYWAREHTAEAREGCPRFVDAAGGSLWLRKV